jgi:hypothetical protein
MKKNLLILLVCLLILFLIGCGLYGLVTCNNSYELKHLKEEKIANQVLTKLAGQLTKKYHLKVVGDSAEMPEGVISNLGLRFHIRRVLKKEELREILVGCVEAFLEEINSNEEIRPYLGVYPFTPKNISIGIIMLTSEGKDVYDPDIEASFAGGGKLWYGTTARNQKYGYKSEYEENFEEAKDLVKKAQQQGMKSE